MKIGEVRGREWFSRVSDEFIKRIVRFLIIFLCVSAAFLVIWWFIGGFYQHVLFVCGEHILLALGYTPAQISAVRLHNAYLTNFNIVAMLALAIATPSLHARQRLKMLALGIPALFLLHLTDLVAHFPAVIHDDAFAQFIVLSIGVAGFAIPIIVWFPFSYNSLFKQMLLAHTASPLYQCPLCNVKTQDIITHIKEAHGKKALKSRKVREFLKKHPELAHYNR